MKRFSCDTSICVNATSAKSNPSGNSNDVTVSSKLLPIYYLHTTSLTSLQVLCQEEIDTVIHDESKCPNGDFTLKALSDLKYMERCLKETLRLYPIAYITGRKLQSPLQIGMLTQ